ncbi:extracellular triacylglycerol lipase precursor [Mycena vulgaris]|nr:extracellular triacylglycerol lipase precursor [Mycena vulgaris]
MLAFIHLATFLAPLLCVGAAPTVRLGNATLVGRDLPLLQQAFFGGIPYAEPPVGDLRLRPPVLKTYLPDRIFSATAFGPACLQLSPDTPRSQMFEDCLTINVFRPDGIPPHAKLPVLFWTYGGSFIEGAASLYNGSEIVARSVARGTPLIYVNFNYRLGPLGFPQGKEANSAGALNLALRDQIAALEWVQLHIGAFGGDKEKVTVFGESAGAIMTALLFLNSPITRLARAAIFESGSPGTAPLLPRDTVNLDWQNFVGGVASCSSLATSNSTFGCLRDANTTEIFEGLSAAMAKTANFLPWDPTIDGPGGLIPDRPSVLFKRGEFARLPFIAGSNLDEGTVFVSPSINSTEQVGAFIASLCPPPTSPSAASALQSATHEVLQIYPDVPALGSPFNTGNETFGLSSQFKRASAIAGDLAFQSQRNLWMETAADAGVRTFGYLFTQPQPEAPPQLGVFHQSEISFVYGTLNASSESASTLSLSQIMTDYWVSFATSLDPNDGLGSPRPRWTQFTQKNKAVMQLNGGNTTMIPDTFRADRIAFFNSNLKVWGR